MIRDLIIVNKNGEMKNIYVDTKMYSFIELIEKYPDMDEEKTLKMDYIWILYKLKSEFPYRFSHIKDTEPDLSKIDIVEKEVIKFFGKDIEDDRGPEEYNIYYNLIYILKRGLLKNIMKINILLNDFKISSKKYEEIRKSSNDQDSNIIAIAKYNTMDLSTIEEISKELVLKLELLKEMNVDEEYDVNIDKVLDTYRSLLGESSYNDFMEYKNLANNVIKNISYKERLYKKERERFRIYDLVENSRFNKDEESYNSTNEKAYLGSLYVEFHNPKLNDESLYDLSDFMYKFNYPDLELSKYEKLIKVNDFMEKKSLEKTMYLIVIMYYKMYGTTYLEKFNGGVYTSAIKLMIEKLVNHLDVFTQRLFNEEYMGETGFDDMTVDTFLILLKEAKTMDNVLELIPRSFLFNLINIYLDNLVQDIDVDKRLDAKLYSHALFSGRNNEDNLVYRELFYIDNLLKNI